MDEEPRFKRVKVSELKTGDCFECENKLHILLYKSEDYIIVYTPANANIIPQPVTYCDVKNIDTYFQNVVLCKAKLLYERMLE